MTEVVIQECDVASQIRREIEQVAAAIKTNEQVLDSNWVYLGCLTHKVRTNKYWQNYGHRSFGAYIATLAPKVEKERSQIYLYTTVAEKLLPQISENDLVNMGATKANELKKYVVESGKLVPQELIDLALNPNKKIDEVKAAVADSLNRTPETKGKWFEIKGFYVSEEEQILLEDTLELAKNIDPVIPHDIPDHVQRKEAVLRLAMEFQSTYGGSNED
jgi:hypothetical protein